MGARSTIDTAGHHRRTRDAAVGRRYFTVAAAAGRRVHHHRRRPSRGTPGFPGQRLVGERGRRRRPRCRARVRRGRAYDHVLRGAAVIHRECYITAAAAAASLSRCKVASKRPTLASRLSPGPPLSDTSLQSLRRRPFPPYGDIVIYYVY